MRERTRNMVLVAAGLCVLLSFTKLAFISFVLVVLIMATTWTFIKSWSETLFGRMVASLVALFALNTILEGVLWVLKVNYSFSYIVLLLLLLSLIKIRSASLPRRILNKTDGLALLLCLGVLFITILPVLKSPKASELIQTSVTGFDDVSHIELVRAVTENKGYFYTNAAVTSQKVSSGYAGYPQGWHLDAATINGLISRVIKLDSPIRVLESFFFNKLLWYGLVILLSGYAIIEISSLLRVDPEHKTWFGLAFLGTSFVLSVLFILPIYRYGYETFLGVLVFILFALVYAVRQVGAIKSSKLFDLSILPIMICFAACCFTWLLGAAVVLVMLVVLFLTSEPLSYLKLSSLTTHIHRNYIVYTASLLIAMTALIQPLVQQKYGIIKDPLNDAGGIEDFSLTALIALSAICLLYFYKNRPDRQLVLWLAHAPLPLFIFVYLYQLTRVKAEGYFTYKVAYILAIFLAITTVAVFLAHVTPLVKKMGVMFVTGSLVIVLSLTPVLFGSQFGYFTDIRTHERLIPSNTASVLAHYYETPNFDGGSILVLRGINSYTEDLDASRLGGALSGDNDTKHHGITDCILGCALGGNYDELYLRIRDYSTTFPDRKLIIITSAKDEVLVEQKLAGLSNVTFQNVD